MNAEDKFVSIAALMCEPTRAKMLWNLLDGRAYSASELSIVTQISPTAASNHLLKLLEAKIIKVEIQGRHRYYHPEKPSIPVKAHYHIVPSKSKEELYAVNVDDGKAHHKSNRGHIVLRKEADELRSLGVNIPSNNIFEPQQLTINESNIDNIWTAFILIMRTTNFKFKPLFNNKI